MSDNLKIACPKCDWEPDGGAYWACSCGHNWNTFDTGGRCPACKKQWKMTACMPSFMGGCSQWSPHIDWYRNLDGLLADELEDVIPEKIPVKVKK